MRDPDPKKHEIIKNRYTLQILIKVNAKLYNLSCIMKNT